MIKMFLQKGIDERLILADKESSEEVGFRSKMNDIIMEIEGAKNFK